jgi:penicillin-insensitive murein DD-endopeptidase
MKRAESPIRWISLCVVALVCVITAAPLPTQGQHPTKELSLRPPLGSRSRSLGYPWEGRLVRGMQLRESRYVRYVPEYAAAGRFYGTWQLVQLLERAARRVALRLPGSRLSVGELSSKEGGDVVGHRSHESGRDADVGFFMTRADGRPYAGHSFAQFDAQGRGLSPHPDLRFDDARNWELVAKLVDDADARVQYIFVAHDIKQRLLREAARRNASAELVSRATAVLVEPSHGNPHRSHFHVRIYCSPADRSVCLDVGPYWAWYPGALPPARASAVNARTLRVALSGSTRVATD